MQWGQIEAYPDEQWDRVIAINLSAVFRVSKHALPHLFASNGCIINMSSAAGLVGTPYAAAYSTAKAGVAGLTRTMAVELADRGVRVNAICPGGVDTPLNLSAPIPAFADMNKVARLSPKTGKMSRPEEIAAGVAYLASEDACNITGITLSIDGGQVAG
jgi:meso-butanediol dehydrogenase/(S,S)-butanediol dehydrogenase/diacetyl reductase